MDQKPHNRHSEIISQAAWLRSQELWREFFAVPASERQAILEKIISLCDELRRATPQLRELLDFFERMATRQGTVMPDFESLYSKKAELDRKYSERDQ